ncbi:MAG: glycosyltransferase [Alsobacter sp.]
MHVSPLAPSVPVTSPDDLAVRDRPSVLHIFKVYYPDLCGGALSIIRDACAGLKKAFRASILVCSSRGGQDRIVVGDVPVERVRSLGDLLSLPLAPLFPVRLMQRIAQHDLLALHAPFPLADLVFAAGLGRSRPLVVHWHADIVSHPAMRWLVHPLMRRTLARAQAIIVSDRVLVERTPLLRDFAGKCHVVPFGVDVSEYDAVPQPPGSTEPGGCLVLACGRLVPYKGFDVLIRAAVGQDFRVWIVGEGRERHRLAALIRELGVGDRVTLLGRLPDQDRTRLMRQADIFAMPSVSNAETFGLVQLEAMAAGKPVVNTRLDTAVPCVARDGIEAITVPPRDPDRLAAAINALGSDPERRKAMGEAARRRALSAYPTAQFRSGLEAVYRAAIARHARPAEQRAPRRLLGTIRVAAALAMADMRHRYARSILGPFWMTLQMAVMVGVLGSVIGHLSSTSASDRLPMLAASLTAWMFFSGVILDSTSVLQDAASLVKDRALTPLTFLLQCAFRQGLFALHNAVVPGLLWLVLSRRSIDGAIAAVPGLLAFVACTLGLGVMLGTLATRFRDLKPIIESTLTLGFLSAPIVWSPEMVNSAATILQLNPLTHLFAAWRAPLTTGHVPAGSALYVIAMACVFAVAGVFAAKRLRRAAFWI